MTSTDIEKVIRECDAAWHGPNGEPLMNPAEPTEVANYRANLEVAYQLALLNETLGSIINSRIPQIRVMVESGEWPLQVQERKR